MYEASRIIILNSNYQTGYMAYGVLVRLHLRRKPSKYNVHNIFIVHGPTSKELLILDIAFTPKSFPRP